MSLKQVVNPAGGLYYHFTALRHRNKLWLDFKNDLHNFISNWRPNNNKLIIIGSSGGYTLRKSFLERFSEVKLIDPDPLATKIFCHRFNLKCDVDQNDYFNDNKIGLINLSKNYEDYSLFFTNILGQLPLIINGYEEKRIKIWQDLDFVLKNHSWCSFHDSFSFPVPEDKLNFEGFDLVQKTKNEVIEHLCHGEPIKTCFDHLTLNQLPQCINRKFFLWPRKPRYTHLIEACFQN